MPDNVTLTRVEYNSLLEQIAFHEDRLRILRHLIRIHRALPRSIWARLRMLRALREILATGTDPGEDVQTLDTP